MEDKGRRIARASVLALMLGLVPATSALGRSNASVEEDSASWSISGATLQAVSETAAPAAIANWVDRSLKAHDEAEEAKENRRLARALDAQAATLRPGSFIWDAEATRRGRVEVVVSLEGQRAWVFGDGKLIGISTVSTGREGHVTPTGRFPILQKKRMHFSNLYNNAPMPNMQRMTWDGVALHAGAIPGYPASHGCVRLPSEFSKLLFGVTRTDDIVYVIDEDPGSAFAALDEAGRTSGMALVESAARAGTRTAARSAGGATRSRAR